MGLELPRAPPGPCWCAHGRAQPQGRTGASRMAPGTALGCLLPQHRGPLHVTQPRGSTQSSRLQPSVSRRHMAVRSMTGGACKPPQSSLTQPLVTRQQPSTPWPQPERAPSAAAARPAPAASPTKSCLQLPAPIPWGLATTPRAQHPPQRLLQHKSPPQTSPQKKPNLEPAAGSPKPRLSPFPTGRAGGRQSGCGDAPGPPAEGLLHRVGAHAGVHAPSKHSEPGHLAL